MIIPLLAALVSVALVAGGEDSPSASSAAGFDGVATSANGSPGESTGAAPAASEVGKTKPGVQVPKAPPPTKLEVTDLVDGTGAEAKAGDEVTIHYVLLLHKNGKEVDSSWEAKPYSFELGAGQVTDGWEQGIEGMREGGRRELATPSSLSYGKAGVPPEIGPDEALVSVIDLLKVKEPASAPGQAPPP